MRLAIISDIHANLEALHATLHDISQQRVDRIVCLGDIVGYNANPAECIALLRAAEALCVAGNHDRAVAGQLPTGGFPAFAVQAITWTRRQLDADALGFLAGLPSLLNVQNGLIAVHGALHSIGERETLYLDTDQRRRLSFAALAAHPSGAPICAFGHTHRLGIYEFPSGRELAPDEDDVALRAGSLYLVNPGTVGQPRSAERRATFIVLDTARQTVTVRRVEYRRGCSTRQGPHGRAAAGFLFGVRAGSLSFAQRRAQSRPCRAPTVLPGGRWLTQPLAVAAGELPRSAPEAAGCRGQPRLSTGCRQGIRRPEA